MSVMKSVTAARGGLLVVRAAETLLEAVAVHLVLISEPDTELPTHDSGMS